jgi:hypothetical protein
MMGETFLKTGVDTFFRYSFLQKAGMERPGHDYTKKIPLRHNLVQEQISGKFLSPEINEV